MNQRHSPNQNPAEVTLRGFLFKPSTLSIFEPDLEHAKYFLQSKNHSHPAESNRPIEPVAKDHFQQSRFEFLEFVEVIGEKY